MLQPPIIAKIEPGSIAEGFIKPGDIVLAVDGQQTLSTEDLYNQIQKLGRDGHPGMIEIRRGEERLALELSPRKSAQGVWLLGVKTNPGPVPAFDSQQRYGVLASCTAGNPRDRSDDRRFIGNDETDHHWPSIGKKYLWPNQHRQDRQCISQTRSRMVHLFSVVAITQLSDYQPVSNTNIDGGHLLYYAIELLKGSPLSTRAMAAGQYIGLALLAGLMGLAFYNDLLG